MHDKKGEGRVVCSFMYGGSLQYLKPLKDGYREGRELERCTAILGLFIVRSIRKTGGSESQEHLNHETNFL